MFCYKCGNQLPDNAKFCNKCGSVMSQGEQPPVNNAQQQAPPQYSEHAQPPYAQPAQTYQQAAPVHHQQTYSQPVQSSYAGGVQQSRRGLKLLLGIGIPAVVVAAVLAVVLVIPAVTGNSLFKKNDTKSPTLSSSDVKPGDRDSSSSDGGRDSTTVGRDSPQSASAAGGGGSSGGSSGGSLGVLPGVSSGGIFGSTGSAWSSSGSMLPFTPGRLDFTLAFEPSAQLMMEADITGIELDGSLAFSEMQAMARLALLENRKLITEVFCALDEQGLSIAFPEITKYYLRFLTGGIDLGFDLNALDMGKFEATLRQIGNRFSNLADEISYVDRNVPLSFGSSTISCNKYTLEFGERETALFLIEALQEVRRNANLIDFITSLVVAGGGYTRDVDRMFDELDDMIDAMSDEFESTACLFRLTYWESGGNVVAYQLDNVIDTDLSVSFQNLISDTDAHIEFNGKFDDIKILFNGDFEKGRDGWNGTPRFSIIDTYYDDTLFSLSARCENIARSGSAVTGTISIFGTYDYDFDYYLTIDLGREGNRQSIGISAEFEQYDWYSGRTETLNLGRLSLSYEFVRNGKIDMPRFDEDFAVYADDYSSSNSRRAEQMYYDIDDYCMDYWGNEIIEDLLWSLRNMVYYMW